MALDAPGVTAPGVRIYMRDTHAFSSLGGYQPSTYELSGAGRRRLRSMPRDLPQASFRCSASRP